MNNLEILKRTKIYQIVKMQCKISDGTMNEQSNYSNSQLSTRNESTDNRLDKIASALTNGFLKFLARFSGKRSFLQFHFAAIFVIIFKNFTIYCGTDKKITKRFVTSPLYCKSLFKSIYSDSPEFSGL